MELPHICGFSFVAFSIIVSMTWLSIRFCSSAMLAMKSATLDEVGLVFISAGLPI
jgi:hypothetical protein